MAGAWDSKGNDDMEKSVNEINDVDAEEEVFMEADGETSVLVQVVE